MQRILRVEYSIPEKVKLSSDVRDLLGRILDPGKISVQGGASETVSLPLKHNKAVSAMSQCVMQGPSTQSSVHKFCCEFDNL